MNIKSLGLKTDLFFVNYNGLVEEKEDYFVVRTPSNPYFWFGNFIVFKQPPENGDLAKWGEIFTKEIRQDPIIQHMLFMWDTVSGELGEISQFTDNGFKAEQDVVLTTSQINTPKYLNSDIIVRELLSDNDWEQAFDNQLACRENSHGESLEDHIKFKRKQMKNYRDMSEEGLGSWYGAFVGECLVCDMGLYEIDGIARFQSVGTHPDFRRKGICATAVYEISKMALEKKEVDYLVMMADENYHAARIYESIGYRPSERLVSVLHPSYYKQDS